MRLQIVLATRIAPRRRSFMRSRYGVREPNAAHFVTSTVVGWLPFFTTAARCDILVEALEFSREKKELKIYAWVILDNHFHAIVEAPDLPRVMMELKRYTAHKCIERLQSEGCEWLLDRLAYFRAKHKTASDHQFWQEGYHPQAITDDAP
jgi:putative transposase